MAVTTQDVYDVLKSMDISLKALTSHLGIGQRQTADAPPSRIASDTELDSARGNPMIKAKSPRDWTGEEQRGNLMSECPPAYLDLLADRYDYFNEAETDAKKIGYNRADAARARGWAARLRAGWKPATTAAAGTEQMVGEDDIPF